MKRLQARRTTYHLFLSRYTMIYQDCSAIAAALQLVTADQCSTLIQQVRRVIIQRMGNAAVTTANANTLGTWTTPLAASDNTRMVSIINKFYDPAITGSEPVKIGNNDNTTPGGKTQIVGETTPDFSGMFTGLSVQAFTDLRTLFAEGQSSVDIDRLGAYIICGDNQLLMHKNGGPIPIHMPFVGTPSGGKLHELTQFRVTWEFDKEWYTNAGVQKLTFNPALLVNP